MRFQRAKESRDRREKPLLKTNEGELGKRCFVAWQLADPATAQFAVPCELPPEVEATLREHEEVGTTGSPEYEEAVMVFYRRHLCRVDPWPDWLVQCFELLNANPEVYHSMNGPSEFHVIGTIKDWDITGQLGQIEAPTLVFGGRYDEVRPAITEAAARGIPGSEYVVMEESSHMAQAEQPEETLTLVGGFLARVEAGT